MPILRSGHLWEFFFVTPRFLLTAPWWLAGNTYLVALTGSAVPGILLLLTSELRLIFRGQSYIESLQVQDATHSMHLRLSSSWPLASPETWLLELPEWSISA